MEFNGTFLVTIITFIVFVFLMNKILYAPLLKVMQERKDFIDGNYKFAQDCDAKSEELTGVINEKLTEAKDDAREKYTATLDEYKSKRAEIVAEAQSSAVEELEQAKVELTNLSNEVKEGLKGSMTSLANDIVEKVIGYKSEVQGFDDNAINEILYR